MNGDFVDLLKGRQNVLRLGVLSSLPEFGGIVDLPHNLLAVVENRNQVDLLRHHFGPVDILLALFEYNFHLHGLLSHELRHLLLVVLLLHLDSAHRKVLGDDLLVAIITHKLRVNHAWLHVQVLVVEEWCLANILHVLGSLILSVLLGVRDLWHLPVLLEHVVWINDVGHLSWHSHHLVCHLRSHLIAVRSAAGRHLVWHGAHVIHVHHWMGTDVIAAMSKGASVLVRALATAFEVFANVPLVIDMIDAVLLLDHLVVVPRPALRHRRGHKHILALYARVAVHVHTLRSIIATAASWFVIRIGKVVILVEAPTTTTKVWRGLISAVVTGLTYSSSRAAWVATLV